MIDFKPAQVANGVSMTFIRFGCACVKDSPLIKLFEQQSNVIVVKGFAIKTDNVF